MQAYYDIFTNLELQYFQKKKKRFNGRDPG